MDTDDGVSLTAEGPLVVVGGTGRQGRAVVAALRDAGAPVRALVRDPGSEGARRLAGNGVDVVRADLDQPETVVEAFGGASAVFAMTTFAGPAGTDGEVTHGRTIGDAARAAGVPRVVYSSVGGADRATGIPHFESKRRVEEHLQGLALRTTFIRPTFFMDNFTSFSEPTEEEDGTLVVRLPLPAEVPLQMVATRDVGRIAAAALLHPDRIPGGAVEVVGDQLTGEQIAAVFAEATGAPARYEAVPVDALPDPDQKAMFTWFSHPPAYRGDFSLTRELVPDVQDLRTWLTDQRA
jgi:uncharacterized protein YbjT (DUF2867 family)